MSTYCCGHSTFRPFTRPRGTFAPAHHAAAYWRDQAKAGNPIDARLINTTSVSGIYGNMGQTNYGAAKAGIAAFTIIAARELKRYGITVNCIAPGALTRLTEDLVVGEITDEMRAQRSPRWVAPIVTWLASTESKDVSGRIFEASGGASKVQTILDPNVGVAGLIQRTRVQGMIVGDGDRGCRMEYVSELANVEVGDVVVTSGLDQIYPKGYTLGVIAAIGEGEGLTKIIEIRPEVDFRRLEEVLVLLKPEGPPEQGAP